MFINFKNVVYLGFGVMCNIYLPILAKLAENIHNPIRKGVSTRPKSNDIILYLSTTWTSDSCTSVLGACCCRGSCLTNSEETRAPVLSRGPIGPNCSPGYAPCLPVPAFPSVVMTGWECVKTTSGGGIGRYVPAESVEGCCNGVADTDTHTRKKHRPSLHARLDKLTPCCSEYITVMTIDHALLYRTVVAEISAITVIRWWWGSSFTSTTVCVWRGGASWALALSQPGYLYKALFTHTSINDTGVKPGRVPSMATMYWGGAQLTVAAPPNHTCACRSSAPSVFPSQLVPLPSYPAPVSRSNLLALQYLIPALFNYLQNLTTSK